MVKKTKVLLIRNSDRNDFGGAEKFPIALALELQRHNMRVEVASSNRSVLSYADSAKIHNSYVPRIKLQNYSGIKIILFPLIYVPWIICLTIFYLCKVLYSRYDVVHPQSRDEFIAGTLAAKIVGKRVVWTDHADLKYIYKNNDLPYKNPVGKLVYLISKLADNVMYVSMNEGLLIKKSLGHALPENYTLTYNGVPDISINPSKDIQKINGVHYFIFASRIVREKGIFELIDAAKMLGKVNGDFRIMVVGEGRDLDQAKKLADDKFIFWGHRNDVLELMKACDTFIFPTHNEAFSIVLLEAAMLGMPTIATDVGGNPEVISNQNSIPVKPRNSKELYMAMLSITTKGVNSIKMGHAFRQVYEKKFRLSTIVKEQIIPAYQKSRQ